MRTGTRRRSAGNVGARLLVAAAQALDAEFDEAHLHGLPIFARPAHHLADVILRRHVQARVVAAIELLDGLVVRQDSPRLDAIEGWDSSDPRT